MPLLRLRGIAGSREPTLIFHGTSVLFTCAGSSSVASNVQFSSQENMHMYIVPQRPLNDQRLDKSTM